jgi:hypothetical protein
MPAYGLESVKNVNFCFLFYFFSILLPTLPHLFVCFTSTNTLSHLVYTVSENKKRWVPDPSFFARVLACATHILPLQIQAQLGQVKKTVNNPPKMHETKQRKKALLSSFTNCYDFCHHETKNNIVPPR